MFPTVLHMCAALVKQTRRSARTGSRAYEV
jgi:hypothetical protein